MLTVTITAKKGEHENLDLPTLKAVILDFSSVNNIDVTSVQQLIDVRNQLDRYTAPEVVDWHLACINNRWTKRAFVSAGFGYPSERVDGLQHRWKSIFSVAEIGGESSAAAIAEKEANDKEMHIQHKRASGADQHEALDAIERGNGASSSASGSVNKSAADLTSRSKRKVAVHGLNRPLFHIDLTSALQSAIANLEARGAEEVQVVREDSADLTKNTADI